MSGNIKFSGPILAVKDEIRSRQFYEEILEQKLKFDFGACQIFESGLTLQRKNTMKEIFSIDEKEITFKANNVVVYFETEDFDSLAEKVSKLENVEYVHGVLVQPWGQRTVSFYDLDGHPIDVSETMESVCKRFFSQGMSFEEVVKATEHPVEFVESVLKSM